jgi:putative hydrolase of the HAD superfamily
MKGVLFDFFGTLVNYSTSRTEQGYHKTHHLLSQAGVKLSYESFLREWTYSHEHLDRYTQETGIEYEMRNVSEHFLTRHAPELISSDLIHNLWKAYIDEWATGITYIDGVAELLQRLASTHRLGVVSNTHSEQLIHEQLELAGIKQFIHHTVTSVEHGRPKPDPSIFTKALDRIGCAAHETLFVGDSYVADYSGAIGAGMRAVLIAPEGHDQVPAQDLISSVLEVENHLTTQSVRQAQRTK